MRVGLVLRALAAVAGLAMFVVAARYAAIRSIDVRPKLWVEWLVTAALVHDLVVAPLAIALGWLVVRFAPRIVKAPLQAGLILTAVVVAMSYPALRGYGRNPSNPTYLPRHYGTGLALTLASVWSACVVWATIRAVQGRHTRHAG